MKRVVILASGNGTNAQALMHKARELKNVEVVGVLSDHSNAGVLSKAQELNVKTVSIEKETTKEVHEEKIFHQLEIWKPDWILLAGYMRILSKNFVSKYPKRIINIHPSLLPKYPGLNAYEQAFNSGDKESGISIHYVDEGMDTGELILQKSFERLEEDSLNEFKERGLQLEHQMYQEILEWIANGKL